MWNWFRRLLGKPERAELPLVDERMLALEREAQGLRLELEERDRAMARTRALATLWLRWSGFWLTQPGLRLNCSFRGVCWRRRASRFRREMR